jgi:hypothetical protein
MVFFGGACPMLLHVKHETEGGIKRFGITSAPKPLSTATCRELGSGRVDHGREEVLLLGPLSIVGYGRPLNTLPGTRLTA